MASEDQKLLTFDEVAKHDKTKDCWLVISGKVYDVTPFMDDHPGGDEVLLSATGKDATNDFEDVGHSDSAREEMAKYYIGEIDQATVPLKRSYITPQQSQSHSQYNQDKKTPEFVIKILQFLVPLFILGLAFAVRYYTKEGEVIIPLPASFSSASVVIHVSPGETCTCLSSYLLKLSLLLLLT